MDEAKKNVVDSLKQANNILVTVRNSPSIDQLAACIALTLILDGMDKHGTAVFSGEVPSILDFLEPEKTIEKNTDSLQDFIISLDKAKADKLRYKVEDTVVKIFITPYRVSLSDKDLEFGQGDFNVDVVVALGVHSQDDLDEAITSHGRILHDATVISINTEGGASEDLGSINWVDTNVSSLSEMVATMAEQLGKGKKVIDNQVATALLTGIVAETERFGNAKTKPTTMEVGAKLLTAGANQELIAAKLARPVNKSRPTTDEPVDSGSDEKPPKNDDDGKGKDGELEIEHSDEEKAADRSGGQTSGFAEENDDFDIPQDEQVQADADQAELPVVSPSDTSESGKDALGAAPWNAPDERLDDDQSPSKADDVPFIQTPLPAGPEPRSDAKQDGEEQAALNFLKEHKVEYATRQKMEPISNPADLLEGTPHIGPAVAAPDETKDKPDREGLNISRFALTPPTMGGTLTANTPGATNDRTTVDSLVGKPAPAAPILSHDRPKVIAPPPELVAEVETKSPQPPALPVIDVPPPAVPVPKPFESKSQPINKPLDELPKPKSAPTPPFAPRPVPVPEPKIDAQPMQAEPLTLPEPPKPSVKETTKPELELTSPQGPPQAMQAAPLEIGLPTLADIEQDVHSPHSTPADDASSSAVQPPLEAAPQQELPVPADMPKPPSLSSIKLPSPQLTSPTGNSMTSPLAPPPPVPPPLPSS